MFPLIFCSCAIVSSKLEIATSLRIYIYCEVEATISKQAKNEVDFPILSLFESDNGMNAEMMLLAHRISKEQKKKKKKNQNRHIICRSNFVEVVVC